MSKEAPAGETGGTLVVGDVRENLGGMALGFDGGPDGLDFAGFANEERAAHDAHKSAAHEEFLLPSTEGFDGFVIRVAEQREIELVLGLEGSLRFHGIGAHAENRDFELIELLLCVTKLGRLDGSTGSIGFGIEEKKDTLALEVLERDGGAVLGEEAEGRGSVARLEHGIDFRSTHLDSVSRRLRMSLTAWGLAWPRVARMTWPTKNLKTPSLPDLYLATLSGFLAMTSRAACSMADSLT